MSTITPSFLSKVPTERRDQSLDLSKVPENAAAGVVARRTPVKSEILDGFQAPMLVARDLTGYVDAASRVAIGEK